ncbi:hypothetical protein P280DRAFT_129573 [Massarina eburnea CBS 473.64]|uniref:Uncharacterized protein n=1 Tax=Massarina eburnea CBS 473.64 TaxID=1395130 RepID=A0A6A6SDF2_9PLEO|nr:hypothetical protein P280DRAFT_129573 [Massarina eburnea CBS 473.64]
MSLSWTMAQHHPPHTYRQTYITAGAKIYNTPSTKSEPDERGHTPTSNTRNNHPILPIPAASDNTLAKCIATRDTTQKGRVAIELLSCEPDRDANHVKRDSSAVHEPQHIFLGNENSAFTVGVKREAASEAVPAMLKRLRGTESRTKEDMLPTINKVAGQLREADEVERQTLLAKIAELEVAVKQKDELLATHPAQPSSMQDQTKETRSHEISEIIGTVGTTPNDWPRKAEQLEEYIAQLEKGKAKDQERIATQGDRITYLESQVSDLVKNVYTQMSLRAASEDERSCLEAQLHDECQKFEKRIQKSEEKFSKRLEGTLEKYGQALNQLDDANEEANKRSGDLCKKLEHRHFNIRVKEEAAKQAEINTLKSAHRIALNRQEEMIKELEASGEAKSQEIDTLVSRLGVIEKPIQSLKPGKKALVAEKEEWERRTLSMYSHYSDLFVKNTRLWENVEQVHRVSFGGMSEKGKRMLEGLRGKPLEELYECLQ